MPLITKDQLTKHLQISKVQQPKKAPRSIPIIKIPKTPIRKDLKEAMIEREQWRAPPKLYTEYRKDLMEIAVLKAPTDNKTRLVDEIMNSKDITQLLFESAFVRRLDEMDGIPKLVLTIGTKIIGSRMSAGRLEVSDEVRSKIRSNELEFEDKETSTSEAEIAPGV